MSQSYHEIGNANEPFPDNLLTEAAELLKTYHPKPDVLQAFKSENIGVIMGPAGSGKDTLREKLILRYPESYRSLLSDTSRPKRPHEIDGVEYFFKPIGQILDGLQKNEYLQAQIVHGQQVSGIHGSQFDGANQKMSLAILVVQTEQQLNNLKSDMKTIFLVPPSYDSFRMRLALKRHMSEEERHRRVFSAINELRIALAAPRYFCIITDTVSQTVNDAHNYLQNGKIDQPVDSAARKESQILIDSILANTK